MTELRGERVQASRCQWPEVCPRGHHPLTAHLAQLGQMVDSGTAALAHLCQIAASQRRGRIWPKWAR